MNILTVNLLFSTLVFWIAARIYVLPRLPEIKPRTILLPILLLHSTRHFGLMFLASGATYQGIPKPFAYPAAFGDLLAAVLAIAAITALVWGARSARFLVWVSTVYDAAPYMGAAYWIPAFWVPALLVTHYITFTVLLRHWTGPG